MNPNHLTIPEIKKQIILAEKEYRLLQKQKREAGIATLWDTEQESEKWIRQFYQPVEDKLKINEFSELLFLEIKHGFVSTYLGGATLNPNGDTVIKIGQLVLAVPQKMKNKIAHNVSGL